MRPPWKPGKSLTELGYDRAFVRVYRALPKTKTALRPGDYLTLGLKFAQEHAVTSAVYNEETFAVVRAVVRASEVIGALNPGEYRYGGKRDFTQTKVVNLADEAGQLLDTSENPARFSRFGMVRRVLGHIRQRTTEKLP